MRLRRLSPTFWIALGLMLATLFPMLLLPPAGADTFSNLGSLLLAVGGLILLLRTRRLLPQESHDRQVVRWLTVAALLWSLAETLWVFYTFVQGTEPDLSLADAGWLLGNLAYLAALVTALRVYPSRATPNLRRWHRGILLVTTLLGARFILWPIAQGMIEEWFYTTVELLYSVQDLLALLLGITLVLYLSRGRLRRPWLIIFWATVVVTLADFFDTYLGLQDLYYANTTIALSRLTDWLYMVNYILMGWGFYELGVAWQELSSPAAITPRRPHAPKNFSNTFGLLYLDGEDRVIGSEGPLWEVLRGPQQGPKQGDTLADALDNRTDLAQHLAERLRTAGRLTNETVELRTVSGEPLTVSISGVAIIPGGERYQGANLVFHAYIPHRDPWEGLSEDGEGMVRYLAEATGLPLPAYQEEILRYLRHMHRAMLRVIEEQFGLPHAQGALDALREAHGKVFLMDGERLDWREHGRPEQIPLKRLIHHATMYLHTLYRLSEQFLGPLPARYEWIQAENKLGDTTLWIAEQTRIRLPKA